MAATMEALLRIKAITEGEGGVAALARGMGNLKSSAEKASSGLKGALSSVGGMSSALGALVPLASGAGLVAMAKGAIDLADDMNDMAQKTGVSVEALSKFKQAAESSGTSVEGVTGAMIKLTKGMTLGKLPALDALKDLGINAKDASGKLKSADEIMLEVADKFKAMPDGANKTAAALQLFGKAGADMIPMLNGGRASIESLTATMSTSFAKGADKFNDKMVALQTKFTQLGVGIGTALMPLLTALTDGVSAVADGFGKLPGPVQTLLGGVVALAAAFVVLAPAISAIVSLGGVVGPAIAAITVALGGLLTFASSTLIPGLLALFSGPVGWTVLAVAAVVAMVVAFREPIGKFLAWLGQQLMQAGTALLALFRMVYVDPWINLWNNVLRQPVSSAWAWIKTTWSSLSGFFVTYVIQPINTAWNGLMTMLRNAMSAVADFFPKVWSGAVNAVRSVINGFLGAIANAVNVVVDNVNRLIDAFNRLPSSIKIPRVPTLSIPKFAAGGMVDGPTLALVGEAGPEYIVPERKMAAAARNYLAGARGSAVLQGSSGSGGDVQISITTGPTLQAQGEQWVSVKDLEHAMRVTADGVLSRVRTPAARRVLGIR
jgi:hypothetical protein